MPDFVVTQSMIDYVNYNKKKARERMVGALVALVVFVVGMGSICWVAGFFR